jgi:hypothetical protein
MSSRAGKYHHHLKVCAVSFLHGMKYPVAQIPLHSQARRTVKALIFFSCVYDFAAQKSQILPI